MPRAFLIKAKKEKKKGDEQADIAVKEINEFTSGTSVPFSNGIVTKAYDGYQVSPSTHHHSSPRKRKQSQNGNERRELSVSENAEVVKTARCNQQSGVGASKIFVTDFPRMAGHNVARKARKRSPKKTVVYYYKVKREDALEGERERKPDNRHETAPLQSVPHDAKAVSLRTGVNYADVTSQGNLAGSYYYSQHAQTKGDQENNRNQTNATGYSYGTASGMYPKEQRDFPQTAPNSNNNVGLDHVKIVEVHSVGKKMDIVYSDKPSNAASKAPENRATEKYQCSRSTASVPASVVPAHYVQREEPVAPEKPPVQASAPLVTPVVHYLPVYAIPSSSGVQYQAVPGAPILEKVPGSPNLFSPVQKNAPVSSQPAYHQQAPPVTSHQPHLQSAMSAPTQQQMQQPPQMHQQPATSATPQSSPHPLSQIPQAPSQGPVMYRPRMMAEPATTPPQPPMGPSFPPVSTMTYHTQAQRVMQSPVYPPQSSAQPVTTLPYVVTKSESMPQQPVSSGSHPVAASQPYLVPVQMVPPPQPQHYPVQSQAVPCQTPYPPQGQKVSEMASYPSPYEVRPTQQPYPVQGVPLPAPHPPLSQYAPTSQPAPPAPSALIVHSTQQQSAAERSSAPLQTFYPTPNSTVHYMAQKRPPAAVHYYPAENAMTQPPQQYQEDKPAPVCPLPYPAETPSQPLTPQYTPNATEQQPKFTYAPPPPDFMYSPVYRVPTATATEDGQPPKGAKRRKTALPHREIRDIPTPPDSYTEAPTEKCTQLQGSARVTKSPGQNPALNKSSCVITPPGSPQDNAEGTYTVVMRDYGIQEGPQTTQSSTEQGRWEVKVNSTAPRVYLSEREALADKYDDEAIVYEDDDNDDDEEEDDEEVESDDDDDGKYSPPQKENMSPDEDFPDDDDGDDLSRKQQGRDMKYTCKFCHKGFQWHSHLLSHERTHTGEKPFKCPECARAFTRADGLQCHMLVHNKKRPFKCQFCSKGFNDNTTLEKHIYSHTGVKPFKCEYCGRAFSDSQSIEKHLLVHVGTKPYKCQFCVRSFNDSQMLVRHIRSHTGEKPFKCQHCQMAFSKQSALVIHTRVHTGEKPYSCPHCSKCFSISGNLQRHILIHTGERPYQCSKCPKAFNNPSHLSRHISKLHAPQVKGDASELSDHNSNLVQA